MEISFKQVFYTTFITEYSCWSAFYFLIYYFFLYFVFGFFFFFTAKLFHHLMPAFGHSHRRYLS